jgi:sterol desaturase/sphingolipid hydroxylase (fatty acid hydroxylase superfamily)
VTHQVYLLVVLAALVAMLLVEGSRPFRPLPAVGLVRRWITNLTLWLLGLVVNFGLVPWIAWGLVQLLAPGVGLLPWLQAGPLLSFIVTLLVLQLLAYGVHRASHEWPWLWRLHSVHHSDVVLDATSSYRHHPIEVLLNTAVALPVMLLLAPDARTLLLYNVAQAVVTVWAHSNVSMGRIEQWLRGWILTPHVHRLHHLTDPHYTNSNYATMLPVLDRLFGTARRLDLEAQRSLPLGLEYFCSPQDATLWRQLLQPFRRRWPSEDIPSEQAQRLKR